METWEESSLILGGLLAGGLAPAVYVLAVRVAPRRSLLVSTFAVAAVTWGLWLANWVVWLFAFDEPIPGETVPNALFTLSTALMHASSVGCIVLLALAMLAGRGRRARALHP